MEVPTILSGAQGLRASCPERRRAFARHGDETTWGPRNVMWELFLDGGALYQTPGDAAGSLGLNLYGTVAQFPSWFKEHSEAWVWLATIPGQVAKDHAHGLPGVLDRVIERLQETTAGCIGVWDSHKQTSVMVRTHLGFLECDQQGEFDVLGLKRRYSDCRLCTQPKADLSGLGDAVDTLAGLQANPNAVAKNGWGAVQALLARFGPRTHESLNDWLPVDTMHTFYADGLLSRLVAIAFGLGTPKQRLPATWLTARQKRVAERRLHRILEQTVLKAYKSSLESRRQLCAYAVWALEGARLRNEQKGHLRLLRDTMLIAAEEEREERILDRLPEMKDLAEAVVARARELYGHRFINRSKVHRLLHLYRGAGKWSRTHGKRNYRSALTCCRPTLRHYSMWRGERLQKHCKRAARKIYKAKVDARGKNVRFLRVQNQEAERWAFKVRTLPAPYLPADTEATFDGTTLDLGGGRGCKVGEVWLVRVPVLDSMQQYIARIQGITLQNGSFLVDVCFYDSIPHDSPWFWKCFIKLGN